MLLPVYVHPGLCKMEVAAGGLHQPQRGLLSGLADGPVEFSQRDEGVTGNVGLLTLNRGGAVVEPLDVLVERATGGP
jgi:hypothetical protein